MDNDLLRENNIARSRAMLEKFSPSDAAWLDELHPQMCIEFPFGAGVGLPDRIEGKNNCAGLLQLVADKLNLVFFGVELFGMSDPNLVLAEYEGKGHFNGKSYEQKYITLLRFENEKLILYREYLDTQVIAEGPGHLSALS